jgi:hypothetical protein
MKRILSMVAVSFGLSLVAGCVADATDSAEEATAEQQAALSAGGTLACTNVEPTVVNTLAVICDASGHCVLSSQAPTATSPVFFPLTVISAGHGYVTMVNAATGVKVVMKVLVSTPVAADVYSTTGLVANCK